MKEEELLQQIASDKNPFRTPEGYFEGFTQKMMQRIKEEDQKAEAKVVQLMPRRRWRGYAAAAVVAGVCLFSGAYLFNNSKSSALFASSEQNTEVFTDDELEDALDYEMSCGLVDNNQIAYYLTEAY